MSKQLIVNADDYGRSAGVVEGILRAHREGIVTSTTAMVNMPDIEHALRRAQECPDLGLGVHLTFSAWRPLLPPEQVPTLVNRDGLFLHQKTVWESRETIDLDELRAELAAQIERFRTLTGRDPDHLDCHHFVHLYPPFFGVYVDLAAQFGFPMRTPFPPDEALEEAVATIPFLKGVPLTGVRDMIEQDKRLVQNKGVPHPDLFIERFFGPEALTLENLLNILEEVPEGVSEMMCHPGLVDEGLADSTYAAPREKEVALLCHPRVREKVEELDIELVTFSVLFAAGHTPG